MTRHAKFTKSERAKTKLKGNKLAKGLNVTKTEFKVKKIIIRDQIRESVLIEDGTEIRSQNIKALLSKLNHHNATNRNEGLRYLKELVTNHPQEASNHLGEIIKGICQLSLDIEKDVRRECFKALNLVLATQSVTLISPFFNVITSYLRCAMTHINKNIQEDSLSMLDCLLLYTPALVAANCDGIFTCFLDMISKLRLESKPERTLTINLGSKLTSVHWRSRVLDRLLSILKAIVERRKNGQTQREQKIVIETIDAFSSSPHVPIRPFQINNTFVTDADNYLSIFGRRRAVKTCELSSLFKRNTGATTVTVAQQLLDSDEGQRIRTYTELLMPLLFETWMEVRPASLRNEDTSFENDEGDVSLSNEAAHTLKTIIDVICQLIELMKLWNKEVNNSDLSEWFRRKYSQQFCTLFMVGFPYSQGDGFKGSKRKSKGVATEQEVFEAGGQKCYHQNLNISFVFTCLMSDANLQNTHLTEKIVKFLKNNLLIVENQVDVSNALIKLLRVILIENAAKWNRSLSTSIVELLALIIAYEDKGKFSREIASKIFNLLCGIVMGQLTNYPKETFTTWLSKLPKMLCQPQISLNALRTFELLAKMKNTVFMENFHANIEAICSNLAIIRVNGIDDQTEGKRLIVNLFFWLESWTPRSDELPEEQRHMIEEVLRLRNIQ